MKCTRNIYSNSVFFISFSGENVDFFSLLESFGLKMEVLAKNIGVDISTLNNMDRDKRSEFLLEKLELTKVHQ